VLSEKAVTEVRFRYIRETSSVTPLNSQPTIAVAGAFTGGGTSAGTSSSTYHSYELQNYTSVALNKHFLKFGARVERFVRGGNSTSTFNGVFTFPSLPAYQITEQGLQNGLTSAQIQAAGGGPSQFVIIAGTLWQPFNTLTRALRGRRLKVFPKMTVSAGLRLETQSHIRDHADLAPRVGIAGAWEEGNRPKPCCAPGPDLLRPLWSRPYPQYQSPERDQPAGVHRPVAKLLPDHSVHQLAHAESGSHGHADGSQPAHALYHSVRAGWSGRFRRR